MDEHELWEQAGGPRIEAAARSFLAHLKRESRDPVWEALDDGAAAEGLCAVATVMREASRREPWRGLVERGARFVLARDEDGLPRLELDPPGPVVAGEDLLAWVARFSGLLLSGPWAGRALEFARRILDDPPRFLAGTLRAEPHPRGHVLSLI